MRFTSTLLLVVWALVGGGCGPSVTRGTPDAAAADAAGQSDSAVADDPDGAVADGGSDARPELPCDEGFTVDPVVAVGQPFPVSYQHTTGYVYIGLDVTGPGSPFAQNTGITTQGGVNIWSFSVSGHAAGVLTLTFTHDNGQPVASCQVYAEGSPPPCSGTRRVVLYGDSITTQHWASYGSLLQGKLDDLNDGITYELFVEGHPGKAAFDENTFGVRDYQAEVINNYAPDIVLLFWGMNSGCNFAAHDGAYRAMIQGFQAAGIVPVILTTIPVCSDPYMDTRTDTVYPGCGLGYHIDVDTDLQAWWCLEDQVDADRALPGDPQFAGSTPPLLLIDTRDYLQSLIQQAGCCTPMYYDNADGVHMNGAAHDAVFSWVAQELGNYTCP